MTQESGLLQKRKKNGQPTNNPWQNSCEIFPVRKNARALFAHIVDNWRDEANHCGTFITLYLSVRRSLGWQKYEVWIISFGIDKNTRCEYFCQRGTDWSLDMHCCCLTVFSLLSLRTDMGACLNWDGSNPSCHESETLLLKAFSMVYLMPCAWILFWLYFFHLPLI